jgi:hypothetical protein
LGRSSRPGGRAGGRRPTAPEPTPAPAAATPSLAAATLPRVWQGVGYRLLVDAERGRALFDFAAVPWPEHPALAWGAYISASTGERLIGAVAADRQGATALLQGPVVTVDVTGDHAGAAETPDPLEVAAQLLGAALDHATALGVTTLYARPQGLDRVWVRLGFIPVPEVALPPALAGRPGVGLYAWRGGSALWTLREAAEG